MFPHLPTPSHTRVRACPPLAAQVAKDGLKTRALSGRALLARHERDRQQFAHAAGYASEVLAYIWRHFVPHAEEVSVLAARLVAVVPGFVRTSRRGTSNQPWALRFSL